MFKKMSGTHNMLSSLLLVGVAVMIMATIFAYSKYFMAAGAEGAGNMTQYKFNTTSNAVPDSYTNATTEVRHP